MNVEIIMTVVLVILFLIGCCIIKSVLEKIRENKFRENYNHRIDEVTRR